MAQTKLQPDMEFVRELQAAGGDSLKKCSQCATCSVACPMSPANNPYPRKEMVWASWGLKDKLEKDIDIWLCHNCGNCADLCPRGARPADMMAAARNMVYKDLMKPSIIGKWMSSAKGLPFLFAIPAVLWLFVWWIMSMVNGGQWFPRAEDGRIVFGQIFYGDYTIDPIFMATFFAALFIIIKGAMKLWQQLKPEGTLLLIGKDQPWYYHLYDLVLDEILLHKKFADCKSGPATGVKTPQRQLSHMLLFYSFCILAFVTAVVAGGHWLGKIWPAIAVHTPLPFFNPIKLAANFGAVMLLVGLGMLTVRRIRLNPKYQSSSFQDWYLLGIIWCIGLTGVLAQCFRLMDFAPPAFFIYYLHLVFVWMLFAYLPWSKLGHLVYRTTALIFARKYGRG